MNGLGLDVEDALARAANAPASSLLPACGSQPTEPGKRVVLHDHCHGISLIKQPQLAAWRSLVSWVHEDASIEQCAMHISDHTAGKAMRFRKGERRWRTCRRSGPSTACPPSGS
jgi:hypothetical protein